MSPSTLHTEFRDQARAHACEADQDLLLRNPIAEFLTERIKNPASPRRQRGRPKKKDAAFFKGVLLGHAGVLAWHLETYGQPARSEAALYRAFRWHVAQTVEADGVVALAARDAVIGSRLKTALNRLSEARAFFRKHPEKPPITGTDKTDSDESNTQEEEQQ